MLSELLCLVDASSVAESIKDATGDVWARKSKSFWKCLRIMKTGGLVVYLTAAAVNRWQGLLQFLPID